MAKGVRKATETQKVLRTVRGALNQAIEGLGDAQKSGRTAMAELLTERLRDDVVGTLAAMSKWLPRDVSIDVQHTVSAAQLTDEELAHIIMSSERVITGTVEQQDAITVPSETSDAGKYISIKSEGGGYQAGGGDDTGDVPQKKSEQIEI